MNSSTSMQRAMVDNQPEAKLPKKPSILTQIGINMVDLMMWLVIAALILAAALQGIAYYREAAALYQMKNDVQNAVTAVHAEASKANGIIDDDAMSSGLINTPRTPGITLTWGTVKAAVAKTLSASAQPGVPTFELASSVSTLVPAATSPSDQYVVVATSPDAPNQQVVYYMDNPQGHTEGMTTAPVGSVPVTTADTGTTTPTSGSTPTGSEPSSTQTFLISEGGRMEGVTPDGTKNFEQFWADGGNVDWLIGRSMRGVWSTASGPVYQNYTITSTNIRIIQNSADGKIKEFVIEIDPPQGISNWASSGSSDTEIWDGGVWKRTAYALGSTPPPYPYSTSSGAGSVMPPATSDPAPAPTPTATAAPAPSPSPTPTATSTASGTPAALPASCCRTPATVLKVAADESLTEGLTPDGTKSYFEFYGSTTDVEWLLYQQMRAEWTLSDGTTEYVNYTIDTSNIRVISRDATTGKIMDFVIEVPLPVGAHTTTASTHTSIYDQPRVTWRTLAFNPANAPQPYPY